MLIRFLEIWKEKKKNEESIFGGKQRIVSKHRINQIRYAMR